jgi:hypothetical protein
MIPDTSVQKNGLKRMILIDVCGNGDSLVMNIEGGTSLAGANGSGKTSILKLIPMFYGNAPSEIIESGGAAQRFIDYYLPHTTSYIVYEYEVNHRPKCAIIARGGDEHCYYLLNKAYDPNLFTKPTGEAVPVGELKEHTRQLISEGELSRRINSIKEYRAILLNEGQLNSPKNDKSILYLQKDFALTQKKDQSSFSKISIAQIKSGSGIDLLRNIVASNFVNENNRKTEISNSELDQFSDLGRTREAFQGVENKRPQFERLKEEREIQSERWTQIEQQYSQLTKKREDTEEQIKKEEITLKDLEQQQKEELGRLDEQIARAELDLKIQNKEHENFQKEWTHLSSEYDNWEKDTRLKDLARKYHQLPKFEADLYEAYKVQKDLLADKQNDLQPLKEAIARLQLERVNLLGELRKKYDEDKIAIEKQYEDKKQKTDEEKEQENINIQNQVNDLKNSEKETRNKIRSLKTPTPEEHPEQKTNQQAIQETKRNIEKHQKDLEQGYRDIQKISANLHEISRKISQIEYGIQENRELKNKQEAALVGEEGSLLHFLNQDQTHDWESTLAKVLRPELLQHKNLNPEWREDQDTVLGLFINTDQIDNAYSYNIDRIKTKIQELESGLNSLNAELSSQKNQEAGLLQKQKEAEDLLTKQKENIEHLKKQLLQHEQNSENYRQEMTTQFNLAWEAYQKQQQTHNDELELIIHQQAELQQQIKNSERAYQQLHREHVQEKNKQLSQLQKPEENEKVVQLSATIRSTEQQKETIENQCSQSQQIQDNNAVIKNLGKVIFDLNTESHKIKMYQTFSIDYPSKKQEIDEKLKESEEKIVLLRERLEQKENDRKDIKQNKTIEIQRVKKILDNLHSDENLISKALTKASQSFLIDLTPTFTNVEDVLGLCTQFTSNIRDYIDKTRHLDDLVQSIHLAFEHTTKSRDWKTEYYKQHTSNDLEYDFLNYWYSMGAEQVKEGLITSCKAAFNHLQTFERQISDFQSSIQQCNQKIQKKLKIKPIGRISEIVINLTINKARIEGLSCIHKITSKYGEFFNPILADARNEIPDEDFFDGLKEIKAVTSGNGISIDYNKIIDISGTLQEEGAIIKHFKNNKELTHISSEGISSLVMIILLLAFVRSILSEDIHYTWCIDEIRRIDGENQLRLFEIFKDYQITPICAAPELSMEAKEVIKNNYVVSNTTYQGRQTFAVDTYEGESLYAI